MDGKVTAMAKPIKVLTIFGTRPEAIKMVPVLNGLDADENFESLLCVTGQHREMLNQVLDIFNFEPDFDLNIMQPGQSLSQITSQILLGLEPILKQVKPDWVLVHGDTATTAAASLAAYYQSIPVGHIEAGLRTYDIYAPWPEEVNRRISGVIAALHFAPTKLSQTNLISEGVEESAIVVTGNTVIDALFSVLERLKLSKGLEASIDKGLPALDPSKKLIVVTGHRRESFGDGLENICQALLTLSQRSDVQIIYPVHLNPYVKKNVEAKLSGHENIHLIAPLGYLDFVRLMSRAHIIISDSGGIQEEAPSLGIPVLVTRKTTERPEALENGTAKLVGHDIDKIVSETVRLLENPDAYREISEASNPFGDGKAVDRILSALKKNSRTL